MPVKVAKAKNSDKRDNLGLSLFLLFLYLFIFSIFLINPDCWPLVVPIVLGVVGSQKIHLLLGNGPVLHVFPQQHLWVSFGIRLVHVVVVHVVQKEFV